jgi:hypothetical protein
VSKADLWVDLSTLDLRRRGPATGNIVLLVDGEKFPAPAWNDFAIVILDAWIRALHQMTTRQSARERVHFMEGPYAVDLLRLQDGRLEVRAIAGDRRGACVRVAKRSMAEKAVATADSVLLRCQQSSYRPRDVALLEEAVARLRETHDASPSGP